MRRTTVNRIGLLLAAPLLAALLASCSAEDPDSGGTAQTAAASVGEPFRPGAEELPGMVKAAETDELKLLVNVNTAEIAVLDKSNGKVWYSNPPGRDADPVANAANKELLASQLFITYFDSADIERTMNSYNDSVAKGQFEIFGIDGGIRIVYNFSNFSRGVDELPEFITKERLEEVFLSKIDEKDREMFLRRYKPLRDNENIYKRYNIPVFEVKEFIRVIDQVGYTEEELLKDKEAGEGMAQTAGPVDFGIDTAKKDERVSFTVPVEYTLDGGDFLASIPVGEIVENKKAPLYSIRLLDYFGAADGESEGYIFVPDGSGALIRLNNGKLKSMPYGGMVYGDDPQSEARSNQKNTENALLPVFGIKSGAAAFLAVIEEGDALAKINADIGGRVHSYNTAGSEVFIRRIGSALIGSGAKSTQKLVFQNEVYQGRYTVRYSFLYGDDADYAGMAARYREYLIEHRGLAKRTSADPNRPIPFYLEAVGAIEKVKSRFGIPVNTVEPLTTFAQAGEIVNRLAALGVDGIKLRYAGWFNGGYYHYLPESIRVEKELGGAGGLAKLMNELDAKGVPLFADSAFAVVHKDGHGFSRNGDAAKYLDQSAAVRQYFSLVSSRVDFRMPAHYYLSPSRLAETAAGFRRDAEKLGLANVSLRDLGSVLKSDMNEAGTVDREEAKKLVVEQLALAAAQYDGVMIEAPNAYALPYATDILNLPDESSLLNIEDESVPFIQMVLHGYVPYSIGPANLSKDGRKHLLRMIETGAYPYYKWSYAESSAVKDTIFDFMYALGFEDWLEEAAASYRLLDQALRDVQHAAIVSHERLADGVVKVGYSNGKTIVVNYNKTPVTVDGHVIEAESFRAEGGGAG